MDNKTTEDLKHQSNAIYGLNNDSKVKYINIKANIGCVIPLIKDSLLFEEFVTEKSITLVSDSGKTLFSLLDSKLLIEEYSNTEFDIACNAFNPFRGGDKFIDGRLFCVYECEHQSLLGKKELKKTEPFRKNDYYAFYPSCGSSYTHNIMSSIANFIKQINIEREHEINGSR